MMTKVMEKAKIKAPGASPTTQPASRAFLLPGELGQQLMALDLECIKYKLVREGGWGLEQADVVEKHYKAYLFLLATQPDTLWVPTKAVDEMWHSHILDTQKYMADCAKLFGRYLHHYPYLGMKDEQDAKLLEQLFTQTKETVLAQFGLDVEADKHLADCGGGGCGGGGSSCSSSSCSSAPASCSTPVHIPSCSTGGTTDSPRRPFDDRGRKREERKSPPPTPPKKPWYRRLGLMEGVDPREFNLAGRPGRTELLAHVMGEAKGNA
jgi:hypothetical protein